MFKTPARSGLWRVFLGVTPCLLGVDAKYINLRPARVAGRCSTGILVYDKVAPSMA